MEIDRGSEVSGDLPIPRVIGGTFNPLENGRLPKKARSKRSWIWDWGIKGIDGDGDKTWNCTLCKYYLCYLFLYLLI
jgi:hypothetical protein